MLEDLDISVGSVGRAIGPNDTKTVVTSDNSTCCSETGSFCCGPTNPAVC